ncbi:MAG: branched-chain amino acid ABC transporter permease [Acidimicrobiales bacterium]
MIGSEIVTGLTIGAGYSLLAVGVVLVYTSTRVLSLALGEMGAFGFYLGVKFYLHGVPLVGWHLSAFEAGITAIVVGALLGLLVERFIMRPLTARPGIDKLIVTLGVALVLALVELNFISFDPYPAPPFLGSAHFVLLGATLTTSRVAELATAAAAAAVLYLILNRTKLGLATRATTSDPTVARLLGVKVNNVYRFAWVTAGGLAGLAGALVSNTNGVLLPFSLTTALLSSLAGAVVGGLDSLGGAIVGCLLLGVVQNLAQPYGIAYESGITLLIVLVVLLVRPQGMFGRSSAF